MVEALEQRLDTHFPPGRNPHLKLLQHQPLILPCYYRPLICYFFFEVASWVNDNMLRAAGYRRSETADGLIYFTKGMQHQTKGASCTVSSAQAGGKNSTEADAVVICQPGSEGSLCSLPYAAVEAGPHYSSTLLSAALDNTLSKSTLTDSASSDSSSSRSSFETSGSSCSLAVAQLEVEVSSGATEELPIVFAHGVGMGLLPYLWFLISLAATGQLDPDSCENIMQACLVFYRVRHTICGVTGFIYLCRFWPDVFF